MGLATWVLSALIWFSLLGVEYASVEKAGTPPYQARPVRICLASIAFHGHAIPLLRIAGVSDTASGPLVTFDHCSISFHPWRVCMGVGM